MWPIPSLSTKFYLIVIALLTLALGASTLLGRAWKAERDEAITKIDFMAREATAFNERSETTAKETSDAFTLLVEQIKDKNTALNAARARFGSCNVAGGITAVRVPDVPAGTGEADRPETTHATEPELVAVDRPFIDHCALDAGHLQLWQQWAMSNQLPISKE